MRVVYARATSSITMPGGYSVMVRHGEHWPADDPIVREHPDLFTPDARYGVRFSVRPPSLDLPPDVPVPDDDEPPVESATANPGERRSARRPRSLVE